MKILAVAIFAGCIAASLQFCFDDHCAHHSEFLACVSGPYRCQADEFCEASTAVDHAHGNAPWVHMNCRPMTDINDCYANQAQNPSTCDPTHHGTVCSWCCTTAQCLIDLASGQEPAIPTAGATTMMSTMMTMMSTGAPVATMTTMAPASTVVHSHGMMSTTMMTGGSTVACVDMYVGDCSVDFSNRCMEPLVQQLCAKTCSLC